MRLKTWIVAFAVLFAVVACVSAAEGTSAVVLPSKNIINVWGGGGYSAGWEFSPAENIVVTQLGLALAQDDTYLHNEHIVRIYDSGGTVVVSAAFAANTTLVRDESDWYTYKPAEPQDCTLAAGQTYVIAFYAASVQNDPEISRVDGEVFDEAISVQRKGLYGTGLALPTTDVSSFNYEFLTAGFKFQPANQAPVADAGSDVVIESADQALTVLQGTASDADGDALQYRWLEGTTELLTWTDVVAGAAPLDLDGLPTFALGAHTLTLEVSDSKATTSASMSLELLNTPPAVSVNPTSQTVEINIDAILITGTVADFDADSLTYEWSKDGTTLESGTVNPTTEGPYDLLDLVIPAGDSRFPLGIHTVTLQVSDGTNVKTVTAEVTVQDATLPTLAPTPSVSMLWPPDNTLRPVTIYANAADNSGGTITLGAAVACNEEPATSEPDWYIDTIDNAAGTISLRLRAARLGKGDGRNYTVTVTATDESGNQSSSTVTICVPHDRRKQ